MSEQSSYKLPTITIQQKEDLIELLNRCSTEFVFFEIEEVSNPVGRQWNLTVTTKIQKNDIGVAIVEYEESFYEDFKKIQKNLLNCLKTHCPTVQYFYKGTLSS